MITDNMLNVVILCILLKLSKVIDQRSHTGREVKHTVHKFTQRNTTYKYEMNKKKLFQNERTEYLVFAVSQRSSHRILNQLFPTF